MLFFLLIKRSFFKKYAQKAIVYAWLYRLRIVRNEGSELLGLRDKWNLLKSSFGVLKLLIFNLKYTSKENLVLGYGSNKDSRAYFLEKNLEWNRSNTDFFDLNQAVLFHIRRYVWYRHLYAIHVVLTLIIFKIVDLTFGKTNYNHAWFTKTLILTAQIALAPKEFNYAIFNLFTMQSYLTASFADLFGAKYFVSFSNTLLFDANRYTHLPNGIALLCSELQKPEVNAFEEQGWFNVRDKVTCGSEDAIVIDRLVRNNESKYDLGVYSSGFWARDERGLRTSINQLIDNKGLKNKTYQVFLAYLLLPALELKRQNPKVKIKVYPHPYERFLYHNHGISPPYLEEINNLNIEFDLDGSDSMKDLFACRVGVAITSTIINDRIALGLEGFYLNNKDEDGRRLHDFFDGRFLGDYQKHLIYSKDWFLEYFNSDRLREK